MTLIFIKSIHKDTTFTILQLSNGLLLSLGSTLANILFMTNLAFGRLSNVFADGISFMPFVIDLVEECKLSA